MRLSELNLLSRKKREAYLKAIGTPKRLLPPWRAKVLTELEDRYGMDSATFLKAWSEGKLPDTADFARWLILAPKKDELV